MPVNFWARMIGLYTFGKHLENPISSVRDTNLPEDHKNLDMHLIRLSN